MLGKSLVGLDFEFISIFNKNIPMFFSFLGMLVSFVWYNTNMLVRISTANLYIF